MGQYYGWAIGGYKCEDGPETNDSMAPGPSSGILAQFRRTPRQDGKWQRRHQLARIIIDSLRQLRAN